ncbi:hypothetical protein AMTRI_Chr13g118830 [Amborella trichopoda]
MVPMPPLRMPMVSRRVIMTTMILPFFLGLVFQSQSSQSSLYQIQCLLPLEKHISLV